MTTTPEPKKDSVFSIKKRTVIIILILIVVGCWAFLLGAVAQPFTSVTTVTKTTTFTTSVVTSLSGTYALVPQTSSGAVLNLNDPLTLFVFILGLVVMIFIIAQVMSDHNY